MKRKPRENFRMMPKHDADIGRLMKSLKGGELLAIYD